MAKEIIFSKHALERWQERVGRGSIRRAIRRARRAGPQLQRQVSTGSDITVLVDYRNSVLFLVKDDDDRRLVITVVRYLRNPERALQ